MAIISLGKIDKNIISIVAGCIVCFLSRLLYLYDNTVLFEHKIISNLALSAAKLFNVIPHVILKSRSIKTNSLGNINKNNKMKLIYTDYTKIAFMGEGKYRYIILSSVLFFIQSVITFYTIKIRSNTWIFEILFILLFYYLAFKIKLYKHHYLSIILIIITGIVLDLSLGKLQNDISEYLFLFLLKLAREIIYSLIEVMNKYLMEIKFCSVYGIIFYNGLIKLFLLGIFAIFNYYYLNLDNFKEYFDKFDYIELLVLLGFLITQIGLSITILFTNKNNTTCHIFIVYVFGQFAYYLDFSLNSIIVLVCLIFILFMSLVFCEIIELNFFGLSDNTKEKIIERARNDSGPFERKDLNDDNSEADVEIQLETYDNASNNNQEFES